MRVKIRIKKSGKRKQTQRSRRLCGKTWPRRSAALQKPGTKWPPYTRPWPIRISPPAWRKIRLRERSWGLREKKAENERRKKLEWTASKGVFGGLILNGGTNDRGVPDPGGDGRFGLGSSRFIRGENGSTKPAGQAECREVPTGFCLYVNRAGEAGGCCKMQQPRESALFQGFADGLYGAWGTHGGHGAEQSDGGKDGDFHGEGFRADEEGVGKPGRNFEEAG